MVLGDGVEISEASVKMVMLNLESVNRLSQTMDAILLLQTVVDLVARRIKSPDKGEALTESQISELKFTFEQVVAPLCECVTISKEKVVKVINYKCSVSFKHETKSIFGFLIVMNKFDRQTTLKYVFPRHPRALPRPTQLLWRRYAR